MKLLNVTTELRALRTICGKDTSAGTLVLGATSEDSFHYPPAKKAYKRIRKVARDTGSIIDWTSLCNDPELDESDRKILKRFEHGPVPNSKIKSLTSQLDNYRKLRVLLETGQMILDTLSEESVNPDKLLDDVASLTGRARSSHHTRTEMFHFGVGNNTSATIEKMLYGENDPVIPTGYKAYDDRNGGFGIGQLVLIGASTGGGKSSMALNLFRNIVEMGYSAGLASLEMNEVENTARLAAILTGIDLNRIIQRNLTDKERKTIEDALTNWIQDRKTDGTRFSVYTPSSDVGIEDVLMGMEPYDYDVICLDYVGLLKDAASGDTQWQKLGEICRVAKRHAEAHHRVVILLVQVSKEGLVKYSQTMVEHAGHAWVWVSPSDELDVMTLEIAQLKARNLRRFPFQLESNNLTGQIYDVTRNDLSDDSEESDEEDDKYLQDLNEHDEDR